MSYEYESIVQKLGSTGKRKKVDIFNTRKSPVYTMTYQAVDTMRVGNRISSSPSCEYLVLEILVPGKRMSADRKLSWIWPASTARGCPCLFA